MINKFKFNRDFFFEDSIWPITTNVWFFEKSRKLEKFWQGQSGFKKKKDTSSKNENGDVENFKALRLWFKKERELSR